LALFVLEKWMSSVKKC